MSKKFLLGLFFLLSFNVDATHLLGGEIVWKCKPNGKYQFTLVLYRECGGITLPTSAQSLATNAGVSISCAFISTTDVVPSCYTGTTSCSGATSGQGKMQKYVYRSGDITLTGTPPTGGWYFTWTSCCRPGSITNVVSPGGASYLLRAVMYPYTPPGATSALSAGTAANPTCFDSSPNFLEDPQVISCTGVDAVYNNLGYDPDLDSLHYNWSYPWDASSYSANPSSNSVNFVSGYTYNSPLPSGSSSTPATIDGETGEISFNSSVAGSWATCVVIEEWRNGQLIGAVYRDLPIFTLSCTPPTGLCSSAYVSSPPRLDISLDSSLMNQLVLLPVVNSAGDTTQYNLNVGIGDSIKLKINSFDISVHPNCFSQNINLRVVGGNMSSAANYGNANSCLFNPPCATLTSLNPFGVFTYPGINSTQFEWIIDTAHLSYGGLTDSSSYEFYFIASDDECPINRSRTIKLVVNVQTDLPSPPNISNHCTRNTNSGILIEWTPNIDTGSAWGYYLIHHYDTAGYASILDTVYPWNTSTYYDAISDTNVVNQYTIQSVSALGLASSHSTIIGKEIQVNYSSQGGIKNLIWPLSNVSSGNVLPSILSKRLYSKTNWTILDSVTGLNQYIDSSSFCSSNVQYEVSSNGNCYARSLPFFESDNTPPDAININYATVNSQNTLEVDFTRSSQSDVTFYRVYELDTNSFYQPRDSIAVINTQNPIQLSINPLSSSKTILITATDSCGNQSAVSNSDSYETLHLKIEPNDSSFILTWNNQINDQGNVLYSIFWQEYNGSTAGNYNLIANQLDTSIILARDLDFENYCGYIQSKSSVSAYYSESNRVCLSFMDLPENEIEFSIRPNPSNGTFTIDLIEFGGKYQAEVTNILGQTVYECDLTNGENIIRLPKSVSPGSYLINLSNKQNGQADHKVLIIK